MSKITLSFMQRFMTNLDTAIRNFVKSNDSREKGTNIEQGTELNNLKTVGTYCIPSDSVAASLGHLPLSLCGKLVVTDNGNGGFVQFYIPNHSPRLYQRLWWSNAWTDWQEYATGDIQSIIDTAIADKQDKPIIMSKTMAAGATSVTFTGLPTTGFNMVDVYTTIPNLDYDDAESSTEDSLTFTYEAQSEAVTVYLKIEVVS